MRCVSRGCTHAQRLSCLSMPTFFLFALQYRTSVMSHESHDMRCLVCTLMCVLLFIWITSKIIVSSSRLLASLFLFFFFFVLRQISESWEINKKNIFYRKCVWIWFAGMRGAETWSREINVRNIVHMHDTLLPLHIWPNEIFIKYSTRHINSISWSWFKKIMSEPVHIKH